MSYADFLESKRQAGASDGVAVDTLAPALFDFQADLVRWSLDKGRAAIFADCGLGKTPMQLFWADGICRATKGNVLIVTPLAVGPQTVKEAEKFGVEAVRSQTGKPAARITVTNYERLHLFDPSDFEGVVCDESSILKNFDGARKAIVTEFLRTRPYRLLATATAAPNDYIELGTSSEALGALGHMDMLTRFFRNQNGNATDTKGHWKGFGAPRAYEQKAWRFKHHAVEPFWRWVSSWARALRKPSDLGFDDDGFVLPPLIEQETVVPASRPLDGKLFVEPAMSLYEQRQERRLTISERCEVAAAKVAGDSVAVVWCHLNDEGDLLERIIPGARQVKGAMSDAEKEETLLAFAAGDIRVLVTKPKIGAFGLNWQHCSHMTVFPSHSYEQYYQSVRRCWRFGQVNPVTVDIITTEGESRVLANLQRKAEQADRMFESLVAHMNEALVIGREDFIEPERIPAWLSEIRS